MSYKYYLKKLTGNELGYRSGKLTTGQMFYISKMNLIDTGSWMQGTHYSCIRYILFESASVECNKFMHPSNLLSWFRRNILFILFLFFFFYYHFLLFIFYAIHINIIFISIYFYYMIICIYIYWFCFFVQMWWNVAKILFIIIFRLFFIKVIRI